MSLRNTQKMKIFRYVVIALKIFLIIVPCIIGLSIVHDNLSQNLSSIPNMVISSIVSFALFTTGISVLSYSITGMIKGFKFSKEKNVWKILTFTFRLAMFLLGLLIVALIALWLYFMLNNAIFSQIGKDDSNYIKSIGDFGLLYILGIESIDSLATGFDAFPQKILYTSLFFIIVWSLAGVVFEILKRTLRGYKKD